MDENLVEKYGKGSVVAKWDASIMIVEIQDLIVHVAATMVVYIMGVITIHSDAGESLPEITL
jgi:hypothetical protein